MSNSNFMLNTINSVVIENSRKSCVKIFSQEGRSVGTGFFISENLIVTCFHVIAKLIVTGSNVNWTIYQDLQATTESDETFSVSCISIPNNLSSEPLFQDFAILKVNQSIRDKSILPIAVNKTHNVAETVVFSGFPLGTPVMVSHVGSISGITKDNSLICIQASTNKGNSGGALVNSKGEVIGIVSLREGGISAGLQEHLRRINESEKSGGIKIMGVDPLQVTKETIRILDQYISTGIGYARNISFLENYINKSGIQL
jgi:S1-C subfamily serine protease